MDESRRALSPRVPSLMLAAVAALGIAVAGCGSSDTQKSSSTAGGTAPAKTSSEPAGVQEAEKFVADHSAAPTSIGDLPPLSKKPPTGKKILYLSCGVPLCTLIGKGVQDATKQLGWSFQTLTAGALPETVSNAWNQAVRLKPDAVLSVAAPTVLYKKQQAELGKETIGHVAQAILDQPGNGLIAVLSGRQNYIDRGKWMANWVVADTKGKANVLYFTTPDFPIVTPSVEGFKSEVARLCPTCKVDAHEVPTSSIGKALPNDVVTAAQRNPEANYVVVPYGDMTIGIPQALQAAGLASRVKVVSANPALTNLANIKSGTAEVASVAEGNQMSGWMMVDAVVRKLVGDELPLAQYETLPPHQYLTAANIDDPKVPYVGVPDYQAKFESLWKLR
ncbi:MAG: ribose transport system substrate-binding protein [Solirubrobacteraceae bacterium]|jgi:ribose transport system substrate-binding protein|nr:ribose transport system substrate-binding protein [Solirubrobacteraceae bacterium]